MALIWTPSRRVAQPAQYARRAEASRRWNLLHAPSRTYNGQPLVQIGAGTSLPTQRGIVLAGAGNTNDGWQTQGNVTDLDGATALTVVTQFSTDGTGILAGRWGSSAGYGAGYGGFLVTPYSSGGMAFIATANAGTGYWYGPYTAPVNDGRTHTVVWRWQAPNVSAFWLDGAPAPIAGLWFNGSASAIVTAPGAPLSINRHGDAGSGSSGAGTRVLMFGYAPNYLAADAQCLSLSRNPWQLFADDLLPLPLTAAALYPTLSGVTYTPGTLTSSGFGIRVTAS